MGDTIGGLIIGFILGIMIGAIVIGTAIGNWSTQTALQATKPCDKTTALVRQNVRDEVWICTDGQWQKL